MRVARIVRAKFGGGRKVWGQGTVVGEINGERARIYIDEDLPTFTFCDVTPPLDNTP